MSWHIIYKNKISKIIDKNVLQAIRRNRSNQLRLDQLLGQKKLLHPVPVIRIQHGQGLLPQNLLSEPLRTRIHQRLRQVQLGRGLRTHRIHSVCHQVQDQLVLRAMSMICLELELFIVVWNFGLGEGYWLIEWHLSECIKWGFDMRNIIKKRWFCGGIDLKNYKNNKCRDKNLTNNNSPNNKRNSTHPLTQTSRIIPSRHPRPNPFSRSQGQTYLSPYSVIKIKLVKP